MVVLFFLFLFFYFVVLVNVPEVILNMQY